SGVGQSPCIMSSRCGLRLSDSRTSRNSNGVAKPIVCAELADNPGWEGSRCNWRPRSRCRKMGKQLAFVGELMNPIVLRDPDEARHFLLQGLWFQRAIHPGVATVSRALNWALTIADAGQPLPPTGFVADLGHVAFGLDRERRTRRDAVQIPGLPPNF